MHKPNYCRLQSFISRFMDTTDAAGLHDCILLCFRLWINASGVPSGFPARKIAVPLIECHLGSAGELISLDLVFSELDDIALGYLNDQLLVLFGGHGLFDCPS